MNTLRTNFILPNSHKILITPYWLFVRSRSVIPKKVMEGLGQFSAATIALFLLQKVFLLDLI
jgi:hypothetical protein